MTSKTHCPKGHPYALYAYVRPNGRYGYCRACSEAWRKDKRATTLPHRDPFGPGLKLGRLGGGSAWESQANSQAPGTAPIRYAAHAIQQPLDRDAFADLAPPSGWEPWLNLYAAIATYGGRTKPWEPTADEDEKTNRIRRLRRLRARALREMGVPA